MMMMPQGNLPQIHHTTPDGRGGHVVRMNRPANWGMPPNFIPDENGVAPAAAAAAAAANPQIVMNAQGGAAMADGNHGGDQRDAFDYMYIGFRVLALLFAVYFSSSASRFFSAFTMLSVFLLFNTLRDFRRWRERQNRRNNPAEAPAANPQPVAPPADEGVIAPVNAENAGQEGAPPVAAVPEPEAGLLSTVLSLVVGFITSLVPDINGVVA